MENRKLLKAELFPVLMLAKDHGHGRFLCCTMEEQCAVDQLLHRNGLLLLLIVCLGENPVPDTSKLGEICTLTLLSRSK